MKKMTFKIAKETKMCLKQISHRMHCDANHFY